MPPELTGKGQWWVGWGGVMWDSPQPEWLSWPLELTVDFFFLNSTSCLGRKPGGWNWNYRESVACRPSMWNQEGGDSEPDTCAVRACVCACVCVCMCVCFLPGAAGLAPYSEALFLLPLCFHVVLVCSSLAVRTQPLGGCTMFLIEEWGWIFAHLEKSQLGPSPRQQQPKGRDKWPLQPHTWQTSSLEHCVTGDMTLRHGGQSSGSCPNFAIDYYYCISQILRHHWL